MVEPVRLAGTLTRKLLMEVKQVVTAVRVEPGWDLAQAFRTLAAGIPRPRTHFVIPEPFSLKEPRAALALFRCVQEILTNAVKHADATTLWIEVFFEPDGWACRPRRRRGRAVGPGALDGDGGALLAGVRWVTAIGGRRRVRRAWIPCT